MFCKTYFADENVLSLRISQIKAGIHFNLELGYLRYTHARRILCFTISFRPGNTCQTILQILDHRTFPKLK